MGIFDRLGTVINSYFNDLNSETSRNFKSESTDYFRRSDFNYADPDLEAAYDELNDYLNQKDYRFEDYRKEKRDRSSDTEKKSNANRNTNTYSWRDAGDTSFKTEKRETPTGRKLPPEELRADFDLLGVPFGADEEICKIAYKKLLKIHHPDRHASHEGNYKKATEKSTKINAAWDRIDKWRKKPNPGK